MRIVILNVDNFTKLRNEGMCKHVINFDSLIEINDIIGILYTDGFDIYQTDAILEARVVDILRLEYEGMCKHKIVSLRVCFKGVF